MKLGKAVLLLFWGLTGCNPDECPRPPGFSPTTSYVSQGGRGSKFSHPPEEQKVLAFNCDQQTVTVSYLGKNGKTVLETWKMLSRPSNCK